MTAARPTRASDEARATILVVEDEPAILRSLRLILSEHKYAVLEATTGADAVSIALRQWPDLVLLDLGLPDIDGVEVASHIRESSQVPIVVLSARTGENEIVEALDHGADDYIAKPFRERELTARIRASLRASERRRHGTLMEFGEIQVDPVSRQVKVRGEHVKLTATEYRLIAVLVRSGGHVVTHQKLLEDVWGRGYLDQVSYLRVYMRHLREKLETDAARPKHLLTEPGIGYRLRANEED